jgi:hypothetical protein
MKHFVGDDYDVFDDLDVSDACHLFKICVCMARGDRAAAVLKATAARPRWNWDERVHATTEARREKLGDSLATFNDSQVADMFGMPRAAVAELVTLLGPYLEPAGGSDTLSAGSLM